MKRRRTHGFSQGNLDGMCGVYSIINFLKLQTSTCLYDCCYRKIFKTLCDFLNNEELLFSAASGEGLRFRAVGQLIDVASSELEASGRGSLHRKTAFKIAPRSLSEFWQSLQDHMDQETNGVILGLGGKHDHWTCLERVTARQIRLFDSDGLSVLNRNKCTISERTKTRVHEMWPTQTYFLSLRCG